MHIEEYTNYQESEVLALYRSVGWTAYTEQPGGAAPRLCRVAADTGRP